MCDTNLFNGNVHTFSTTFYKMRIQLKICGYPFGMSCAESQNDQVVQIMNKFKSSILAKTRPPRSLTFTNIKFLSETFMKPRLGFVSSNLMLAVAIQDRLEGIHACQLPFFVQYSDILQCRTPISFCKIVFYCQVSLHAFRQTNAHPSGLSKLDKSKQTKDVAYGVSSYHEEKQMTEIPVNKMLRYPGSFRVHFISHRFSTTKEVYKQGTGINTLSRK